MNDWLSGRFQELNDGLEAFVAEMKAQQRWDDITIVMTSEFGRTLIGNTGRMIL